MVSKASDAALWQDLKDIRRPTYDRNPLNLDGFPKNLDDWDMTVSDDMDAAQAEKYMFKRFRSQLPELLLGMYLTAAKEEKIKTIKDAKRCLNEQERLDAPQTAATRWRAIKLQRDGKDIHLREWRDFRRQYLLHRWNVKDCNENDEQSCLLNVLPDVLDQAGHQGGSEEGQEPPHRQDDTQQEAPQTAGQLDYKERGPGLQEAFAAERPPAYGHRRSPEGGGLAPGRE